MVVLSNKPAVAYGETFFKACEKLSGNVMKDVMSFIQKFLLDPTSRGLNYEKIRAIDPALRSVRINGSYRAIVRIPDESAKNTYFLLWVDAHDDAYEWARRKTILHDSNTNSITLVDVREEIADPIQYEIVVEESAFSKYSDLELTELGIVKNTLFMIRAIKNKEQLEDARSFLASHVYENLNYLLSDIPYDEVLEMHQDSFITTQEPYDIDAALTENINKNKFFVSQSEEDDILLERFFKGELDEWRIFLHPTQNKYVEADYEGPVRILGGPGTGKSVVAMHRARYLLEKIYIRHDERILFTTYSSNLSEDLEDMLKKILTPKDFARIDILNIDKVIYTLTRKYFEDYKIVYDDDLKNLWTIAYAQVGIDTNIPVTMCISEYHQVILQNNLTSCSDYFSYKRIGRGTQLNRKQKNYIWKVIENYKKVSEERKQLDTQTAEIRLENFIKTAHPLGLYQSIIVDEVQDFKNTSLILIRSLAGQEKPNDLFLVGDNLQRIYQKNNSLENTGISLGDRSFTLTHNYRTTSEIASFARSIIGDFPQLESDQQSHSSINITNRHGNTPAIEISNSINDEKLFILKTLRKWLSRGIKEESICILVRTKTEVKTFKEFLTGNKLSCYEIKPSNKDDKTIRGLRITTMHRAKGLEFECVVIAGMNNENMPNRWVIQSAQDQVEKKELEYQERLLLYVAVTRAKQELAVTASKSLTPFIL